MSRKKRTSPSLAKIERRLLGMRQIDEHLDLGEGVTVESVAALATTLQQHLDTYNRQLVELDAQLNQLIGLEKEATTMSVRILSGVQWRFGRDSSEYEQVGGTRLSERSKSGRKPKGEPTAEKE